MALALYQKLLTIFVKKHKKFVWLEPYYFVQISSACDPNTYQIMYGETF